MASAHRVKTASDVLKTVEAFLDEVAHTKKAEANLEPGSIGGETSHPVRNVDDNTQDAPEGERARENERDVRQEQGPASVNAARAESGTASADQIQIGTRKAPTGEQPSVETESAGAGMEDPGTDHPARVDNDALNGGKYAVDLERMPLSKLAQLMEQSGNELCAAIAVSISGPMPEKVADYAGWDVAGLLDGTMDKEAADAMAAQTVATIVKEASDDAERVADWLESYGETQMQALQKAAEAEAAAEQAAAEQAAAGQGGGDEELAALLNNPEVLAALQAHEAGGAPAGAGGGDEVAALLNDPEVLAALQAQEAGGAPENDQAIDEAVAAQLADMKPEELAEVLSDAGVTEEDLAQALAEEQGAGAAGEGAGTDAETADKIAQAIQNEVKQAAIDYVREVIGRSRNK